MSLVTRNSYAPASRSNTAGKGLVLAGGTGLAVSLLAAVIPFVGVLGTSLVLAIVGLALLAKR